MNFFRRKKIKCNLCSKTFVAKKAWKVKMNTAEGEHKIKICETCAENLNMMKDNQSEY